MSTNLQQNLQSAICNLQSAICNLQSAKQKNTGRFYSRGILYTPGSIRTALDGDDFKKYSARG